MKLNGCLFGEDRPISYQKSGPQAWEEDLSCFRVRVGERRPGSGPCRRGTVFGIIPDLAFGFARIPIRGIHNEFPAPSLIELVADGRRRGGVGLASLAPKCHPEFVAIVFTSTDLV